MDKLNKINVYQYIKNSKTFMSEIEANSNT